MARGLLPVPNSLLTFSSALSQGGPQHLTPVSRRGQGAGDTCGGLKWAAPSPHAPALPWVTGPRAGPSAIYCLFSIARQRNCLTDVGIVTHSVSPWGSPPLCPLTKGRLRREPGAGAAPRALCWSPWARGTACPCTPLRRRQGPERRDGRKEGFSAFCGLFLCYFCSPGQLLLPKVMILGPYSYLCFCPGAFVGDELGVRPARHSGRAGPAMCIAINNCL